MENSVKTINPRRTELKELSAQLKPLAIESQTSLNAALVFHYAEQTGKDAQDFKTLATWNEEGYTVRKGEKSFMIWAKPEKMTMNLSEAQIGQEAEVVTVYKLVHLFHVGQVFKRQMGKQEITTVATPTTVKKVVKKSKTQTATA